MRMSPWRPTAPRLRLRLERDSGLPSVVRGPTGVGLQAHARWRLLSRFGSDPGRGVIRPSGPVQTEWSVSARVSMYKETVSGVAGSAGTPRASAEVRPVGRYARLVFAAVAARAKARARLASSMSGAAGWRSGSAGARSDTVGLLLRVQRSSERRLAQDWSGSARCQGVITSPYRELQIVLTPGSTSAVTWGVGKGEIAITEPAEQPNSPAGKLQQRPRGFLTRLPRRVGVRSACVGHLEDRPST